MRLTFSRPLGLALATTTALTQPLWAEEALQLDPITVQAVDADGSAADRGSSIYVADAELERARLGDLKDLFAGLASVSVGGALPVAQKIFVNGVDMLNLSVTVDGVEQNNRAFHHVSANAIDPGLLKFVRVDAGVGAADAGPHALAGAVVMETVDAADVLEEGDNFGGTARLSYGDNGETLTHAVTLAGRAGGFEWLGYRKTASGADYETGAGKTIAGSAADLGSSLAKIAYESDSGHRFELSGQELRDAALRPYRANIGAVTGRPVPQTRLYDTTRRSYSLSYENTQASGFWDPRVVIGRSQSLVDVDQPTETPRYTSHGASETRSAKVENRFHLAGESSVTLGLDHYDRSSDYYDIYARRSEAAKNTGVYAQARLHLDERTEFSTGLRWDRQEFTGVAGQSLSNAGVSANASLAYDLTEALTLRAGSSSVFGGIGLEDNYVFRSSWTYAGLEPSRAANHTLGLEYTLGALTLDGGIFVTNVENARGTAGALVQNFDFKSRGYTLGANYGWEGGSLRASLSKSDVTLNDKGASSYDLLDYGAPLGTVFALEAQHTPEGSAFTFGGSLEAAARYKALNSDSEQQIAGYGVVNLFAEYAAPQVEGLVLRADLLNALDKDYTDRATYGGDYSSVTTLREPGRVVQLGAVMKF